MESTPKLSRSEIVRKAWLKRRETFVPPMKGKSMSQEARQKMSDAAKARPSNRTGKTHTAEARAKISAATRERTPRGASCHSFKDGRLAERRDERFSQAYKRWRFDVFCRDHFKCQRCGDASGGNLHAHHVQSFADYPALRFDVANGLTLCEPCHKAEHV